MNTMEEAESLDTGVQGKVTNLQLTRQKTEFFHEDTVLVPEDKGSEVAGGDRGELYKQNIS